MSSLSKIARKIGTLFAITSTGLGMAFLFIGMANAQQKSELAASALNIEANNLALRPESINNNNGTQNIEPIGETGSVVLTNTIDAGVFVMVNTMHSYDSPVVVAFINTRNDDESVDVRVRNVTSNSFEIFMQEPDNGTHTPETASYVVMEEGNHYLADTLTKIEAGKIVTSAVHIDLNSFTDHIVKFSSGFGGSEALISTLNTHNNNDFMSVRSTVGWGSAFKIMQEQAGVSTTVATTETIGWIAFAPESGTSNGVDYEFGWDAGSGSNGVDDTAETITFTSFTTKPNLVVANGYGGNEGFWARGAGEFSAYTQTVYSEEDQVGDSERGGINGRNIGWAAFEPNSVLYSYFGEDKPAVQNLTGISASSVAWGDYDNDGDLDVLLTGYDGSDEVTELYDNANGAFTKNEAASNALQNVTFGDIDWGDYDNDGDLDIALTGCSNSQNHACDQHTKIYRNDNGTFTNINAGFLDLHDSSVAWGDYDNDGDLDLLVIGQRFFNAIRTHLVFVYQNEGGGVFTEDTTASSSLTGVSDGDIAWGDYDNDGDLDILLAGYTGSGRITKVYRNDGGAVGSVTFTEINDDFEDVQNSSVAWGDYDNDGDLDILLTGSIEDDLSNERSRLYENSGGSFSTKTLFGGIGRSSVAWGDYDNDGDLDILLAGSRGGTPTSEILQNSDGVFSTVYYLSGVMDGSVAWVDYDNDGDLDISLTGHDGTAPIFKIYRNLQTTAANTVPSTPSGLNVTKNGNQVELSWNASTDAQTITNTGLTYNIRVGSSPGGSDSLAPMACVGSCGSSSDGYRQVVGLGNAGHRLTATLTFSDTDVYYWSVQAIDTAFAASPWAAENSFQIGYVDLGIDKQASVEKVFAGDTLNYTLSFVNDGSLTATNVVITDQIPSGLTNLSFSSNKTVTTTGGVDYVWQVEELSPNESGQITVTAQIANNVSSDPITNSVEIGSSIVETATVNNQSQVVVTVYNCPASGTVSYVDVDATGGDNTGKGWSDAFTNLQLALDSDYITNCNIDEIWVAAGRYTPGNSQSDSFNLISGVAIYGGFAATETLRSQRDWEKNVTVLSGDIDNDDTTNSDGITTKATDIQDSNSYHVVNGNGSNGTALLDGFMVTAGQADGSSTDQHGGGMINILSHPSLNNVAFIGNLANESGGGMYNDGSSPTLNNVKFSGNRANNQDGGGLFNRYSLPSLSNVIFSGNRANDDGGGLYNYASSPNLVNATFSGNSAGGTGGGMANVSNSDPNLTNIIVWNNQDSSGAATPTSSIDNIHANSVPSISHSIIQHSGGSNSWESDMGTDNGNNLDADPLFAQAVSPTNAPTADGDFRLLPGSVAIDSGLNSANSLSSDIGGDGRIVNTTVDMGAYESQGFSLAINSGNDQTAGTNSAYATPLEVTVSSDLGKPVGPGGIISFIGPSSGAGINPTVYTATTNSSGVVSSTVNANGIVGTFQVTATTNGVDTPENFTLNSCLANGIVANNNDSGSGSLRRAISESCVGDTITFDDNFTITLASTLLITKNLTIDGGGFQINVSGNGAVQVFNIGANVSLKRLTVSNGSAQSGGGIYVSPSGNLMLESSALINNESNGVTTTMGGAGLFNDGATTLVNTTVAQNRELGSGRGGGIHSAASSVLDLTHVTIANNEAPIGGGLYFVDALLLTNSIVADNSNSDCTNDGGTVVKNDRSLIEAHSNCGSPYLTSDPLLAALDYYGGTTPNYAVYMGSPVINQISQMSVSGDQRGLPRSGGHDIGAFESQGYFLTIVGGNNQTTEVGTPFADPLAVQIEPAFVDEPIGLFGNVQVDVVPDPQGAGLISSTFSISTTEITSHTIEITATANITPGNYIVQASAPGANDATFNLTNFDSGPGGVSSNLALWLKANSGISNQTDGSSVSSWVEQSDNGWTANNISDTVPSYHADALNFNPAVTFGESGASELSFGNNYITSSVANLNNGLTMFAVVKPTNNISDSNYLLDIGMEPMQGYGLSYSAEVYGSYTPEDGGLKFIHGTHINGDNPALLSHKTLFGSGNSFYLNGHDIDHLNHSLSEFDSNLSLSSTHDELSGPLTIGRVATSLAMPPGVTDDRYFRGDIAEVLIYRNSLDDEDRRKVESYLGWKYGITLLNGPTPISYTHSGGTVIWDGDSNSTYHNDVAGIGRDDGTIHSQLKSRSVNESAIVTMANGDDIDNPDSFAIDRSILMWGNDGQSITTTETIVNQTDIIRLQRIWRVQETGNVTETIVSFDLDGHGLAWDASHLALLISNSSDFSNATFHAEDKSIVGNTISFSQVDFADGDYFTLILDQSLANLAISKQIDSAVPYSGDSVTYTLTFSNTGEGDARDVIITDIVPSELMSTTTQSSVDSGVVITSSANISYSWTVSDLAQGKGGIITITGVVSPDVAGGSAVPNTAVITTSTMDEDETDNSATAFFTISQYALTTTLNGNGSGVISSTPAGIDCDQDCNESFNKGTVVTLTRTADLGSAFTSWDGACTGSGDCAITMNGASNVTATFTLEQHDLNLIVDGNGRVTSNPSGIDCSADCTETYNYGTNVTLTAVPDANHLFTGWSGACMGSSDCVVIMSAAQNVTASFTLEEYDLTVSVDGGGDVVSIPAVIDCGANCSETYAYGTVITLTAIPDANYLFVGWDGACTGSGNCVVTMNAAQTVTASFALEEADLNVTADGNGTVSSNPLGINCGADCTETYAYGTVVTLTAVPDPNYLFIGWDGACTGSGDCVVTMSAAQNVAASFSLQDYDINVTVNGGGSVTSSPSGIDCGNDCTEAFEYGTVVTLTAVADANYTFAGWSGACTNLTGTCVVTLSQGEAVTATFEENETNEENDDFTIFLPLIIRP